MAETKRPDAAPEFPAPRQRATPENILNDRQQQYRKVFAVHNVPDVSEQLENALFEHLDRGSDAEVISMARDLVRALQAEIEMGSNDEPMSPDRLNNLKAVLVGATMALESNRDQRIRPQQEPKLYASLARRFLELVSSRVGTIRDDGLADVRVVVYPNQTNGSILVRGKDQ